MYKLAEIPGVVRLLVQINTSKVQFFFNYKIIVEMDNIYYGWINNIQKFNLICLNRMFFSI